MIRSRHVADITDPVTGETTTVTADSAAELDRLIAEFLDRAYPDPTSGPASAEGQG
jgi:hypothetical protein